MGWKKAGKGLNDRLVKETAKFRGGSLMIWGCMLWEGVGYACKINGRMDGELYTKILEDELQESLAFYDKALSALSFSKIIIQSISVRGPLFGLKSMDSRFFYGQLSLQILIPLSTCGISKKG